MSDVISAVREKYPQYKDVPDDQLTVAIGQKYPTYLAKDPAFKADYERLTTKTSNTQDESVSVVPSGANISDTGQAQLPTGEQSTTYGGPPKAVASLKEALVEPVEAAKEVPTHPGVELPRFTINKDDSVFTTIGKEAMNVGASVPEFMTSGVGVTSVGAGVAAPAATAAVFTATMLHDLGKQIVSTYRNWGQMNRNEKIAALTDMAATGGFATLTGHAAVKGFTPKTVTPEIDVKVAAAQAAPVAPLTAAVVSEQIKPEAKAEPPTPTKESEAPSASKIESPMEVPSSETPAATPQVAAGEAGKLEAPAGKETEKIVSAAVKTKEGKVETGANHPEVLARLGEAQNFPTRESRNTERFGFVTDKGRFVTRPEAAKIAEASGQKMTEFDVDEQGKPQPHSDEIASTTEPGKPIAMAEQPTKPSTPAPIEEGQGGVPYYRKLGEQDALDPNRKRMRSVPQNFKLAYQNAWYEAKKSKPSPPTVASEKQGHGSPEKELAESEKITSQAAVESEKATQAWGKHVEEVVNPLKQQIRKVSSEVHEMLSDANRTKPETKGKNKLTIKSLLAKYGVSSKEELNDLYKKKNAEWATLEKQLDEAESKRKELESVKERRGKEWSTAATRSGDLRRQVYPKAKEGDVGESLPPDLGMGGASKGGELQMAVVPGAKEFVEQDLIPFAKEAAKTIGETAEQARALLAPPSMSPEGALGAGIVRERAAELAQKDVRAREQFGKAKREMDSLSKAGSLQFIDRMERGGSQPTPELTALAKELRVAFDKRVAEVRALGTGKLNQVLQDYFPHIWKDPDAAVSWYARILGKRPLRGPGSFLKKRTIPTTADGIAAGLEPVTYNPIELALLKMHEIDRYVMGQKIFNEFKEKGLLEFSRSDIPPEGKAKINDRIANVIEYRPTTKVSGQPVAPERVLRGHWYANEDAARVLNNFLSPGLERFKWFRALRWVGNNLNMAQLGLSGYHGMFTMIDSATSKTSLGIEKLGQGKFKEGAETTLKGLGGTVLANQIDYFNRGSKVLREYTKPGSVGGEYAKVVDALLAAGGRTEMPKIFKNSSLENFFTAARSGNYPGALLRAPFAAIEAVSYPLMQVIVPRLKLGAFSEMALHEIERIGPNVSRDEFRANMGKIWDSVDNRMGELVYDNLFWDRTLKDLSFLGVRAVGWNLGTLRELGGGVVDSAKIVGRLKKGEPVITKRMAYLVALPMTVGLMGALYQTLRTGKPPEELRDYYYPKTGETLPNGTPERVNFPSYLKDIQSYKRHPLTTVGHKLHPMWSEMIDMIQNKDFYGTKIRNEDDTLVKQVMQEAEFVGKSFIPFSVKGAQRRVGSESVETKAESFFGIMPISPEILRSKAQQKIVDFGSAKVPQGAHSQEAQERLEFKRDLESQLRLPSDYAAAQKKLAEAQKAGALTKGQRAYESAKLNFERTKMQSGMSKADAQWLWRFRHLTADEAEKVYELATPEEKKLFDKDLKAKRARAKANR